MGVGKVGNSKVLRGPETFYNTQSKETQVPDRSNFLIPSGDARPTFKNDLPARRTR